MQRTQRRLFSSVALATTILVLGMSPGVLANQPDEFAVLSVPAVGSGAAFPYIVLDRYNGKLSYCYANINHQFISSGHCTKLESIRRDEPNGKIIRSQFSSAASDRPHYELMPLQSGRGTPLNGFIRIDTETGETDVCIQGMQGSDPGTWSYGCHNSLRDR